MTSRARPNVRKDLGDEGERKHGEDTCGWDGFTKGLHQRLDPRLEIRSRALFGVMMGVDEDWAFSHRRLCTRED
jgi:hypothetical protein